MAHNMASEEQSSLQKASDAESPSTDVESVQHPDSQVVELNPEIAKVVRREVKLAMVRESYSGPMPKPDHMEHYERIVPGAAKDILEEFKANGLHGRRIEKYAIESAVRKDARAQWMAFILVALGFCLIAYLAIHGHAAVAGVVAGTLLVAVIAGFLTGKLQSSSNTKDEVDDE